MAIYVVMCWEIALQGIIRGPSAVVAFSSAAAMARIDLNSRAFFLPRVALTLASRSLEIQDLVSLRNRRAPYPHCSAASRSPLLPWYTKSCHCQRCIHQTLCLDPSTILVRFENTRHWCRESVGVQQKTTALALGDRLS